MRVTAVVMSLLTAGSLSGALLVASPADAQSRLQMYGTVYGGQALYAMRNFRPGYPGLPQFYYQGARGYSNAGWEYGRMQSIQRYGTDPGPWPGWRGALFGR